MDNLDLRGLKEFLAAAETLSFSKAAKLLGVTPTAVGQSVRQLEARLGLTLFDRTTRRVVLTKAGARLCERVGPAFSEIGDAIDDLNNYRDRISGKLRIAVHSLAWQTIAPPIVARFRSLYPAVELEIETAGGRSGLALCGIDIGITLGELIEPDERAAKLGEPISWAVVASPDYVGQHGVPAHPRDLTRHQCIRLSPLPGNFYRWEFIVDGKLHDFPMAHPITVDRHDMALLLGRQGLGLTYTILPLVSEDLNNRSLVRVLEEYMPRSDHFYVHFTEAASRLRAIRAFVDLAASIYPVARPQGSSAIKAVPVRN